MQTAKQNYRAESWAKGTRGVELTLLDLVSAVSEEVRTDDDRLVASVGVHLLSSGRAKLVHQGQG